MFGVPLFENFSNSNCTSNGNDPWRSGSYVPCCPGTKETLKVWDNDGRNYFKCIGQNCTSATKDPWSSGSYVPCCSGTTKKLKVWDNDGRSYFKCVSDSGPTGPTGPTDPCAGVSCPDGQHCENGVCVDSGGGGGGTTNPSAGIASVKVGQAQYLDLHEGGDFQAQNRSKAKNKAVYNYKQSKNVNFENSNIVLNVKNIAYNVKDYDGNTINALNSGSVISTKGYKKGVFMVTATVPKCNNLFPAIWLTAPFKYSNSSNPCYIEIDIMETMQHTDQSNPYATANLVFPTYGDDGKCTYYNVLRTMGKSNNYGAYRVQDSTWSCDNSPKKDWEQHNFVLYWDEKTIMTWVDPNYDYSASSGTINITPKNKNSFRFYTFDDTPDWQKSFRSIGNKNPLNQPLNIVMNIASADKIDYNAPGSKMTISKVLYFPLTT